MFDDLIKKKSVIAAIVSIAISVTVVVIIYSLTIAKEIGKPENYHSNETEFFVVKCNCVIFSLDDVQDYWLQSPQLRIMDTFLSRDRQLSLGLIMGHIGNDHRLVDKVRDGISRGLFESGLEGWHYVNYTKLSEQEQESSLREGNNKMQFLFGHKSQILIPPKGVVNEDTLKAMDRSGMSIFSDIPHTSQAEAWKKNYLVADNYIPNNDNSNRSKEIIYLPYSTSFKNYTNGKVYGKSVNSTVEEIQNNIDTFGYAVLLIHPQDIATLNNQTNSFEDTVDPSALRNLMSLIDTLESKGIRLSSFSELAFDIVDTIKSKGIRLSSSLELPKIENVSTTSSSSNFSSLVPVSERFNESNLGSPDAISLQGLDEYHILLASIYNNYGKYIYERALEEGVSPSAVAATLFVESHGLAFGSDERMTIRFEACIFFNIWGRDHPKEFGDHFQCNLPNDTFRMSSTDMFVEYHGDPSKEWKVFEFARELDEDAAMRAISMGLGQIMGFHYDIIGYSSPRQMFDAMSKSTKSQLDGFFSGVQYTNGGDAFTCLDRLKSADYVAFAACYNGVGRDITYADQLLRAMNDYKQLTENRLYSDSISES